MPGLFFDTLERIDVGPRVHEEEFDLAITPRVRKLAKKYDIKYDPAHVVPNDDAMADRLFAAALEFAVETGLWVLDTQKVIRFSEAEIWRRLDTFRSPLILGHGKDQVMLQPRKPESTTHALVMGGAAGSSVTEGETYVKLMMQYASEPTIDMVTNGNPAHIEGLDVRPNSPLEVHGAIQEVGLIREAVRRVGRPGMPLFVAPGCAASAAPAIAVLNEERGIRRGDFLYAALLTEMKTDYDRLCRAVAAAENGVHIVTLVAPMIGGWAGRAEGAAITGAAATLMGAVAYDASIVVHHPVHMSLKNGATTHRETLWVESIVGQAVSRNTRFPIGQNVFVDARAGTKQVLYEAAANALVAVSSGQHVGPGPSGVVGGTDVDMISGMEARVLGEVSWATEGMSRDEANRLTCCCLDEYEPTIGHAPRGKRIHDLYDMDRLKPTGEWLGMYEAVRADLKHWGVPLR